ncbi:peptidylprolyl isomerase [Sphingobium aquiterrae]|uniref:peptidylprolyl isomerase n=1 Tax=Sphingobium aquiterrae TaxID=2038656 RepID=UPI0030183917
MDMRSPRGLMAGVLAFALIAPASAAQPQLVVRMDTTAGTIRAVLEAQAAPVTVCNFLRYMRAGHFDGGTFFRTVRSDLAGPNPVPIDVIQMQARAGPEFDGFGPIPLEPTSRTGLGHVAGALSMARWGPDTATSSWSIVVRPSPEMDFGGRRNPDGQGFAVFGRVIGGMDVVRAIHRSPAMDETLRQPVMIRSITAERQSRRRLAAVWSHCPMPG